MRKNLGNKNYFLPLPVTIIATYDENGKPNAMNAAWAGIYDYEQITVSLAVHKTTDNFMKTGALTVAFGTVDTMEISDYFGIVSGNDEDKILKSGVHITKSEYVDAPIIEEFPLVLECTVDSFENGTLIAKVVNCSVDEKYLKEDGSIDVDAMKIITFDTINATYRVLGNVVGDAFKVGKPLINK